jgi:hypothetical protein
MPIALAEWYLLWARTVKVRSHHEELSFAPAMLTAISLLLPFAGSLWARIRATRTKHDPPN